MPTPSELMEGVFEALIRSTDNVRFSIDGLIDASPDVLPSEYEGDSGLYVALSTSGEVGSCLSSTE